VEEGNTREEEAWNEVNESLMVPERKRPHLRGGEEACKSGIYVGRTKTAIGTFRFGKSFSE